jgi:hypothetical protein
MMSSAHKGASCGGAADVLLAPAYMLHQLPLRCAPYDGMPRGLVLLPHMQHSTVAGAMLSCAVAEQC